MAKRKRRPSRPRVAQIRFDDEGRIEIINKELRELVTDNLRKGDNYLILEDAPFVVERAICGFPPRPSNLICPCDPDLVLNLRLKPKKRPK